MRAFRLALLVVTFALAAVGCPNCAPDQVGAGVARLTVRNVGAMASLVGADATCGFKSPTAVVTSTGDVGGLGNITTTVTDCEIDAGASKDVSTDCNGGKTTAAGKIKITASQTIAGVLTGNTDNPIIPATSDSVTVTITSATFTNFEVTSSTSTDKLKMESGTLSAVLKPRLAVSSDPAAAGACAIPTSNVQFTDIKYGASKVFVDTKDNKFEADVEVSNIAAQNGVGPGGENAVSGSMTVFGSPVDVAGADPKLDPDYDAAKFKTGYSCTPNLASPESFTCGDPTQAIADGAARLTVKMLGTVAGLVDADTTCGFASGAVQQAGVAAGAVGDSGTLTLTVAACTISFAADTNLGDDCGGVHTIVNGSVTVSGTKTVSGRFTGNATTPIVPDSDTPAVFHFTDITVANFSVGSSSDNNVLLAKTGTLAGDVTPRTTLSTANGSCSIATPSAHLAAVAWTTADLLVSGDAGSFSLGVDSSNIDAVNGTVGASTNTMSGTMTVAGTQLSVPSANDGLNPAFDPAAFDASFACTPDITAPPTFQCTFVQPIAIGAAQLTMRTFGTLLGVVDANTTCGFGSVQVGGTPTFAGGGVGDDGVTATFTLPAAGCVIDIPQATVVSQDCLGNTTTVSGTITVTGTKAVTGFETGDPTEPVIPTSRQPAHFALSMDLAHTVVTSSTSTASLTVHTGTLAGEADPVVALDVTTGACSIATPNVFFSNVAWTNGDVTLVSDGSSFNMALASTDLAATNGTIDVTASNAIGGTITVDTIPVNVAGPLDPAFDQATFDSTYICPANGNPILVDDAGCSFRAALAPGAAGLLVKAAGIGAQVMKANDQCGFSAPAVVGGAVATPSGNNDGLGTVEFTAGADCLSGFANDTVLSQSCQGTTTHAVGGFTTSQAAFDVVGFLTGQVANPVFPLIPDAATIDLTGVTYAGFHYFDQLADTTIPVAATLSGNLDVLVSPISGESISDSAAADAATGGAVQHVFSEATPVSGFSGLSSTGADLTIVTGGKTFNIHIDDANLDAFNGSFNHAVNTADFNDLEGTITIDGIPVTIAPGTPLVTPYDQTAFDAAYSCDPDLQAPDHAVVVDGSDRIAVAR